MSRWKKGEGISREMKLFPYEDIAIIQTSFPTIFFLIGLSYTQAKIKL
jgi:hypothetical protein